ncbi:MAG: precorrin-6y C5,15-methyltransferase (decarboxylating) subunit CbiE [Negativicutes bacterium]|nr:precorrin-6y C5,15-methyltransferase (decarboxylating) subunit CbiE [Negativicutes bacterium]
MEHRIIVVGIGPGSPDYLPPIAKRQIDAAKVLVGSRRALAAFAPDGAVTRVIDRHLDELLAFVRSSLATDDVVVMVSGDPGFYSLLVRLRLEFRPEAITVIPGISSVQLAFARLACPWQDADLISLHGREADADALAYRPEKKLGILTDDQHHPGHIAGLLLAGGWPADSRVWLCSDLSYPNEQVMALTLAEVSERYDREHCVMVVEA